MPKNESQESSSSDTESQDSTHSIEEHAYKMVMDGRNLQSMHGCPIDAGWLVMPQQLESTSSAKDGGDGGDGAESSTATTTSPPLFRIQTEAAQFILVVEKEGIYNRLSEDRFFDKYPCILVTGKGFPDFSTRALVQTLHHALQLPVYGLVDCNPFGVQILNTYAGSIHKTNRIKSKKRSVSNDEEMTDDEFDDSQGTGFADDSNGGSNSILNNVAVGGHNLRCWMLPIMIPLIFCYI